MDPSAEPQAWIETFQKLLHYYVPPLAPTAPLVFSCLAATVCGLYLVFRSARAERQVVCCFAAALGGWLGWQSADLTGVPGPIPMAVAAVIFAAVAYRTYRYWLAAGSVLVLFVAAVTYQLGRGDLARYLPRGEEAGQGAGAAKLTLPTAEEQYRNLHDQASVQLDKIKQQVVAELKSLGPMGWLAPLCAALVGLALAIWALRVFAIIWLSLMGAVLAVLGVATMLSAQWPQLRNAILSEPRVSAGVILLLWIVGLGLQAKEARLPKRAAPQAAGGSGKTGAQGAPAAD